MDYSPEVLAGIRQELAKRHLIDFGALTFPGWKSPKHIVKLAEKLEKAERGEIKYLCISAPPGHGKSSLMQTYVPWSLGKDPQRRTLVLSASERLARRNSWMMRDIVQSEYWPWKNIKLVGESLEDWQTNLGGGVRSVGQTGTVTGFRAEMILCDDIQPDAGSDLTRQAIEDWFRGVLTTRLEPSGVLVIINTRWHDADLIGRLQDGASGTEWQFINVPAISLGDDDPSGEGDFIGRPAGEALWPERFPIEALEKIREAIGPQQFEAQYQGNPVPVGGATFQRSWFEDNIYDIKDLPKECTIQTVTPKRDQFDEILFGKPTPRPSETIPLVKIIAMDSAWKDGTRNDWSAAVTLVSDLIDIYLVDCWYGQVDYIALQRIAKNLYDIHQPRAFYVEEAASGLALVPELKRATNIPIIGVPPGNDSKVAKAEAITGWLEAGRVKFPRNAPWMKRVLDECLRFPFGRHDDVVDALRIGIKQMIVTITRIRGERTTQRQVRNLNDWMGR